MCQVNIYFLIIDGKIDETAITKKKKKRSRQLVVEESSTLTICGILCLKVAWTSGQIFEKIMKRTPYFLCKLLTIRLIKCMNKTYYSLNFILKASKMEFSYFIHMV